MSDVKSTDRNIHIEALKLSLGAPSLEGLAYSLRHPETWPEGFVWDFNECSSCAMGLAHALWNGPEVPDEFGRTETNRTYCSQTARMLGMPLTDVEDIFLDNEWTRQPKTFLGFIPAGKTDPVPFEDVTPEMVADAIDAYIARQQ